ncbi:MAG: hypothetical protein Q4E12_07320 [Coriobacteriia bacterium]|nr:hypothetical protein [Coriobacteriia bacterium]
MISVECGNQLQLSVPFDRRPLSAWKDTTAGILNSISSASGKCAQCVDVVVKIAQIKSQMTQVVKRRKHLIEPLGTALYEVSKDHPAMRKGHEAAYNAIAECDKQLALLEAQVEAYAATVQPWVPVAALAGMMPALLAASLAQKAADFELTVLQICSGF